MKNSFPNLSLAKTLNLWAMKKNFIKFLSRKIIVTLKRIFWKEVSSLSDKSLIWKLEVKRQKKGQKSIANLDDIPNAGSKTCKSINYLYFLLQTHSFIYKYKII